MAKARKVVVVGAGMGGLSAALRLARLGLEVTLLEARAEAGGLASGLRYEGLAFDAGPYVLLDRPGLEWAFRCLGLELGEHVQLRRIEQVYEVASGPGDAIRISSDLEETAAGLERSWPGSGARYRRFITSVASVHERLRPLLTSPRPGLAELLLAGAWRDVPFLLRSLRSVLARTGLPGPVLDALGIWTHVAGQTLQGAPSPMAFVPALIHTVGAFYAVGGIRTIPEALAQTARTAGVDLQLGTKAAEILCEHGKVQGVRTESGQTLPADAVISNAGGAGTYLKLLRATPERLRRRLEQLPLQSPGVCAYLAVRGPQRPPYLRFRLPAGGSCQLLVTPGAVSPEAGHEGWWPARLMVPMEHGLAQRLGQPGQQELLERALAETWWRGLFEEVRPLATRVPAQWGAEYHLYRDSMNPVMSAQLMRAGRLAHRSKAFRGLYLAGSSTHPGQWVSFCAISGILAAEQVREDLE